MYHLLDCAFGRAIGEVDRRDCGSVIDGRGEENYRRSGRHVRRCFLFLVSIATSQLSICYGTRDPHVILPAEQKTDHFIE
jgi:hypothetical protein